MLTGAGAAGARYNAIPQGEEMDWQGRGLCRDYDSALWFPEGKSKERLSLEPKAICRDCPVLAQCATWALTKGETVGVWGALSEGDRRRIWSGRAPRVRRRHLSQRPAR